MALKDVLTAARTRRCCQSESLPFLKLVALIRRRGSRSISREKNVTARFGKGSYPTAAAPLVSRAIMNHETAVSKAKEIADGILAPAARQNDKEARFSSEAIAALG